MKKSKQAPLIEFKGSTAPVIVVTLRSLEPEALHSAAQEIFGDSHFFDGDAGLLELAHAGEQERADWDTICQCFARHGLKVIGVRGGNPALQASAQAAGLPVFPVDERSQRPAPQAAPSQAAPSQAAPEPDPTPPQLAAEAAPAAPGAPDPGPRRTLIVDRPLRSGQQVYARGCDLVVLAAVNPGAEVIADGNIHIYAPLRGRALAGATGDSKARIFTTRFEAELVSVAGVYRTFETGVPDNLAAQPVQVKLGADASSLLLEPLKLD
ncbi:MAG: septum site-determining protein MinC [Azovibrio sp.]|uniref:septum site-determining protein MinC n=1 Tax=Azovibrio sp. TaxID=1872673 RepID=UPI003C73D16A